MKAQLYVGSLVVGRLPFYATVDIMQTTNTKEQILFIPGPQGRLEIAMTERPPQAIVGVVCHPHPLYGGSMNNKVVTTIAKAWQEMGLATLRFNFRGVGGSDGSYGQGVGEVEDLEAVLRWLHVQKPLESVWLAGFSFGTFISAKLAQQGLFPVNALLSVAPPLQNFDFSALVLPPCPWIIIQGGQDEWVSAEQVLDWYQGMRAQKPDMAFISLLHATHFFHGQLAELKLNIQMVMGKLLDL